MPKKKNLNLLESRNKKLVELFDKLFNEERLRFDDVLQKLKWEYFFIEEDTIIKILKKYGFGLPTYQKLIENEKDNPLINPLPKTKIDA